MSMYKESQFWLRVVLAILAAILFFSVHNVYWPVIVSLIITFILIPVRDMVQKGLMRLTRRNIPIDISILISFAILIFVLSVLTNIILRPLVEQVNLLAVNFNTLWDKSVTIITQIENEQTQFYIPDQVKSVINDAFAKVGNYGVDGISNFVKSLFAIAGTVVQFFVVPIITFYFMKDGGRMVRSFICLYPVEYRLQLDVLFNEIQHVLSSYIRGQLTMSCIAKL